jgi:Domain of unknown function (DUF397)
MAESGWIKSSWSGAQEGNCVEVKSLESETDV